MPSKRTYELNDPNYRVYFKGRVLDKKSSNEDWDEWVNYPADLQKRKKRESQFKKLPTAGEKTAAKPKQSRAKKAASIDIHKAGSEPKAIDNENNNEESRSKETNE